jgi:hypothetical protein
MEIRKKGLPQIPKWMFKMANCLHFYRTAVIRSKEVRTLTTPGQLIIIPIKSHNYTQCISPGKSLSKEDQTKSEVKPC